MAGRHVFIVPELDGPISGGTLYNRELVHALQVERALVDVLALPPALANLRSYGPCVFWLDSLYLDAAPNVLAGRGQGQVLGLLLHYLPSLVEHGDAIELAALSQAERAALACADWVLVPSESMRATACRLGAPLTSTVVIEPGRAAGAAPLGSPEDSVNALLVGTLTAGKGILPLLEALAVELAATDRFCFAIVGDERRDPSYAEACARVARENSELRTRLTFTGALPHEELLALMERSNLLLSASRMESYGMALAEARHLGLPIIALPGGNVAAHVSTEAGGELAGNERALARAAARLCRDPAEHQRRRLAAISARTPPRSWRAAALEFLRIPAHQPAAR